MQQTQNRTHTPPFTAAAGVLTALLIIAWRQPSLDAVTPLAAIAGTIAVTAYVLPYVISAKQITTGRTLLTVSILLGVGGWILPLPTLLSVGVAVLSSAALILALFIN